MLFYTGQSEWYVSIIDLCNWLINVIIDLFMLYIANYIMYNPIKEPIKYPNNLSTSYTIEFTSHLDVYQICIYSDENMPGTQYYHIYF